MAEIASFARREGFGSGPGSLYDVYISDEFETLRDTITNTLGELEEKWREADENPNTLRRHLLKLEEEALEEGMTDLASSLRIILRGDLNVDAASALVAELADRGDLTRSMNESIERARTSLRAIVRASSRSG